MATAPTRTIVARRMARPARRQQLVRAAAAAFLDRGFDGTTMETVADHAGVTRMLVYRHFESKDALYRAVLGSAVDALRSVFAPEVVGQKPGVAGQLLIAGRAAPDAFRLLWRHARHEPEFAAEALAFRQIAVEFADSFLVGRVADPKRRRWSAGLIIDFLFDGICDHLDEGDPADDAELALHLFWGTTGMVSSWSQDTR